MALRKPYRGAEGRQELFDSGADGPLESVATTCYSKGSVDRLEGAARRRQATPLEPEMEEEETQHQRVQYSMHSSEHIYQVFTHL